MDQAARFERFKIEYDALVAATGFGFNVTVEPESLGQAILIKPQISIQPIPQWVDPTPDDAPANVVPLDRRARRAAKAKAQAKAGADA